MRGVRRHVCRLGADRAETLAQQIRQVCFSRRLRAPCRSRFLVANELEDPFGSDDNDLPVIEEHRAFVAQMRSLLRWLPADTFGAVTSSTAGGGGGGPGGRRARLKTYEIEMDTSWQTVARAIGDGSLKATLAAAVNGEEAVQHPHSAPAADVGRGESSHAGYDIPLGHRGDAEALVRHPSPGGPSEPGSPHGSPCAAMKQKKRRGAGGSRRGPGANSAASSGSSGSAPDDAAAEQDAFAA